MKDGLYRVEYHGICAGFVVRNACLAECAPILRKRIEWWLTIATRIGA